MISVEPTKQFEADSERVEPAGPNRHQRRALEAQYRRATKRQKQKIGRALVRAARRRATSKTNG